MLAFIDFNFVANTLLLLMTAYTFNPKIDKYKVRFYGSLMLLAALIFQALSSDNSKVFLSTMLGVVLVFLIVSIPYKVSNKNDTEAIKTNETSGFLKMNGLEIYVCLFFIALLIIGLLILNYYPFQTLKTYQRYDLSIKFIGSIGPIVAALVAALAAYWKFHKEKNRQLYENRLKEVYAPLVKLLVKQESYRKMFAPQISMEQAPIIYTCRRHHYIEFKDGQLQDATSEEQGELNRNDFIATINKSNYGLIRPQLLSLSAQYELLVKYEEEFYENNKSDIQRFQGKSGEIGQKEKEEFENTEAFKRYQLIAKKCVSIENDLVREIIDGYNETVSALGLDDKQVIDLKKL